MKRLLALGFALGLALPALAASSRPVDVDVILDLLDSGVSESTIERYLSRNHLQARLTAEDLKDLKKAGASDAFISFLQDMEDETMAADSQTRPAAEGEGAEGYGGGGTTEAESSTHVYFGFGFGFGYPYYYDAFYYPAYYYPYYPAYYYPGYYYPGYYPCNGYPYYPYYGGSGSGTGVYSYWHNKQTSPRGTRPGSSATYRTVPRSGAYPQRIQGPKSGDSQTSPRVLGATPRSYQAPPSSGSSGSSRGRSYTAPPRSGSSSGSGRSTMSPRSSRAPSAGGRAVSGGGRGGGGRAFSGGSRGGGGRASSGGGRGGGHGHRR